MITLKAFFTFVGVIYICCY